MKPTFFADGAAFRAWLETHHDTATELVVGFHKKSTGRPSITWPEAVDQALCFGWIDGIRRRVDEKSYSNRFTPRRRGSNWSAVNIARVGELTRQGLMREAGLKAFERRLAERSRIYSYEDRNTATLEPHLEKRLKANRKAWQFLETVAPSYRRTVIYWVTSAKTEETRLRRLDRLIEASMAGRRVN